MGAAAQPSCAAAGLLLATLAPASHLEIQEMKEKVLYQQHDHGCGSAGF